MMDSHQLTTRPNKLCRKIGDFGICKTNDNPMSKPIPNFAERIDSVVLSF